MHSPLSKTAEFPPTCPTNLSSGGNDLVRDAPRNLIHCPPRAFGHYRIVIRHQLFQNGDESRVAAVAHGDHRISPHAGPLGAANGRAAKLLPEFFGTHL